LSEAGLENPNAVPLEPGPSRARVLRAAGSIGSATLLSRVLGLAREQVFAYLFGAGNLTDAFNLAFRLPSLLRNLLAEGALSAAIVPVFTRARKERGEDAAWRLARRVFLALALAVSILAGLGILLAPSLVGLYAPAFREIPGKFELAVRMTRILFPFFPLVALAAAFMGVLNSCGVFFVPALAPAIFNFVSVGAGLACVAVSRGMGARAPFSPIEGMALGVLAGGAAQALCQVPALFRAGYGKAASRRPADAGSDRGWHRDPHFKSMLWLMLPGTLGLAATQINVFVNTVLATGLGPGAVSQLSYAFRLMQFPIGIFGASIAQAVAPAVARHWVERDPAAVEATLTDGLRHSLAACLPASAGLAFLSVPIVELIFQYGRFYPGDVRATAWVLSMYAIGLSAYAVVKLLVPACYALGNARLPLISSALSVGVTLLLSHALARTLGVGGLALSTSIAAILEAVFLLVAVRNLLRAHGGSWRLRLLTRSVAVQLGLSLSMGFLCFWGHHLLNAWFPDAAWVAALGKAGWVIARFFKVGAAIGLGLAWVFVVGNWVGPRLGVRDVSEPIDIFVKKLKNMLRRSPT
jgi:putative peptidoglycan lipid II flippase